MRDVAQPVGLGHDQGVPVSSLIVCHAVWDVLVFLVAPIAPPSKG